MISSPNFIIMGGFGTFWTFCAEPVPNPCRTHAEPCFFCMLWKTSSKKYWWCIYHVISCPISGRKIVPNPPWWALVPNPVPNPIFLCFFDMIWITYPKNYGICWNHVISWPKFNIRGTAKSDHLFIWSSCHLVIGPSGHLFNMMFWSFGQCGHLVIWTIGIHHGHLVIRSSGHLLLWS